jgi:transposase InsO family protein
MPWKECSAVSARLEFVELAQSEGANVALLCRRFGISRKTAYKWMSRYKLGGIEHLKDQSRRPHHSPSKTAADVEQKIVELRQCHRAWGGRKLAARLAALGVKTLPAASTITSVLRRHDLLDQADCLERQRSRRFERAAPNDLWQMDFKGHVPMRQGGRCHPLTVLDDHSRYAIVLSACGDEKTATVQGRLTEAFRRYGLPWRMLMDNGAPWGAAGWAADSPWTRLTLWLARLGVGVSHGRPCHPQTQGKEERFHRTLVAELLRWRTFADLSDAQGQLDPWRFTYNHERPHEALGMAVPAQRYTPSPRSFPEQLPTVEYDSKDLVRRVRSDGKIKLHNRLIMIGSSLIGERVAVRPTRDEGLWDVYYCQQGIGRIDERADGSDSRLRPWRTLAPLASARDAE